MIGALGVAASVSSTADGGHETRTIPLVQRGACFSRSGACPHFGVVLSPAFWGPWPERGYNGGEDEIDGTRRQANWRSFLYELLTPVFAESYGLLSTSVLV